MTRDVATAGPGDDIWETADRLLAGGFGGMPVLSEAGALVGMVSGFDLLSKRGRTIGEIMSRGVVFLDEAASVDEVVGLMGLHGIRRVPLCSGGRLTGILTRSDLLRAAVRERGPDPAR